MRHIKPDKAFRGIGLLHCEDTRLLSTVGSLDELCLSYILDSIEAESLGFGGTLLDYEEREKGAFAVEGMPTVEIQHRANRRTYRTETEEEVGGDTGPSLRLLLKQSENAFVKKLLKASSKSRYSAFLSPGPEKRGCLKLRELRNLV